MTLRDGDRTTPKKDDKCASKGSEAGPPPSSAQEERGPSEAPRRLCRERYAGKFQTRSYDQSDQPIAQGIVLRSFTASYLLWKFYVLISTGRERRVRCDGGRSPGCSACVRKARWDGRNIDTDLGCYYKEPASSLSSLSPSPPVASCSTAAATSYNHSHDQDQKSSIAAHTVSTPSKKPLSRRAARKPKGSTPPAEQPAAPLQKGLACIACKARRVKCSGSKPACDSCVRNARWNGRCPDTEHGCVYRADLPRKNAPYHPPNHRDLAHSIAQKPFLSGAFNSRMKRSSSSCGSDGSDGEQGEEEGYYSEEAFGGGDSDLGVGGSLGINLGCGNASGSVEPIGAFDSICSLVHSVQVLIKPSVGPTDEDVKPMIVLAEEEFDPAVCPAAAAAEDPSCSLSASDVLLSEPEFALPHPTEPTFSTSPRLVPSLYASSSTTDTSSSCPSPLLASPSLSPLGTPHAFFGHDLALVSYPPMPYPPASYWTEVRLPPPPPMFELDWDALRLDNTAGEDPMMLSSSLFKGTGMFGKEMVGGAGLERSTTVVIDGDGAELEPVTVDPRLTMRTDDEREDKGEEESWKRELGDLMNEDVTREWGL
ncbi:BZ3500_MvSof-1268-A1-R1_Chr10-1g02701 [Microbotryum saponariae]|uniref:BZ3500_MvSof-1268-A1-R1_Chr10-1g02701 protein n=1 Tax=Microbotryum saponariae TaxID=289078 RepID=A0A2X0LQM0_9BASI|nr:BZ3500_MvSof-1268-A1-R1_Chr10-1g02701 [Microbotryum saponariae]SDA06190.1 BZ3501_MvSof-1269-A2-R1_Chr10-1g02302 [Microbotryum saponariae]